RETGDNVVSIVEQLQRSDITIRSDRDATYFDIGGTVGISYGVIGTWITSVLAVLLGALAWIRITRFLIREEGLGRWVLGLAWMVLAVASAGAGMVGATAALRAAREVYHPWYAHPDRLFLMLTAIGGAVAWMVARAGRWIPLRARGLRHPAMVWTYTLPVWIGLAGFGLWAAPAAAYLWTLPLLSAGLALLIAPPRNAGGLRIASVVILAISASFWLRDTLELLRFMVAVFGRLPFMTPVYVYPALIALAGLMIAPPLFAAAAGAQPLLRPALATAVALAAVAITSMSAWLAPAYTADQPLRRYVRAVQEQGGSTSMWKVGSLEPGLDLGEGAPSGWATTDGSSRTIPWLSLAQPFVLSTTGPPLGPAPGSVSAFALTPVAGGAGTTLSISVIPKEPALAVSFVLPAGLAPARSTLPGVVRQGRWTATFVAVPREGVAWEASFAAGTPEQLKATRVVVTSSGLPGAPGWQRLPAWLPQEHAVWNAWFTWVLDPAVPPALEPVAPLR
ncbi:MAG: hypothetical protein H0W08_18330, partial [Acidobacteria bacterium]|nr:hypothetical protein [Acidobacteriota bacterium]